MGGVKTYLLSKEKKILPFLADSLRLPFLERIRFAGVNIISNDIKSISVSADKDYDEDNSEEDIDKAMVHLSFSSDYNNQQIAFEIDIDLLLLSSGRDANSDKIDCDEVGVKIGKYGRILVDQNYQTANPNIFAVGDVIGPPGLASFAQKQASHVADLLFNRDPIRVDRDDSQDEKPSEMEENVDDDFFVDYDDIDQLQEDVDIDNNIKGSQSTNSLSFIGKKIKNEMDIPLTLWTEPEVASVGKTLEDALKISGKK